MSEPIPIENIKTLALITCLCPCHDDGEICKSCIAVKCKLFRELEKDGY